MDLPIISDAERYKRKLHRLKQEGLEEYFSRGLIIVPQPNGKSLRIPISHLDIPRFTYKGPFDEGPDEGQSGRKGQGKGRSVPGVGQGSGKIGDPVDDDHHSRGYGRGHGSGAGEHAFSELSLEEAADLLGEQLELPNLLEKFGGSIGVKSDTRYKSIQPTGPTSLRNFPRTFKQALKRAIASGTYDPRRPLVVPRHEDERFRAPVESVKPATKAAVIYLLDYSGSMYGVIDFLQNVGWWANAWIKKHYKEVEHRYIQYDSFARQVPANEFYSVEAGGGTSMNAGLQLAKKVAQRDFPEGEYNLYLIHFTDGDCFGLEVTAEEVAWHKEMVAVYPEGYSMEDMPHVGNPLTDFLIPRSSAIFVCEAGAYYDSMGYTWGGSNVQGNYSQLLKQLIGARPSLEKKLRVISFEEMEIETGRGLRIKETLRHWFK